MEFFYLVKATQKSGKPDAVVWLSANTQSRAALQLDVALEDAGIETGRGKDYAKPVRTDFPVFNDLPEESTIDYTWCERYTLADDQRTWNVIPGTAPQDETALAPASTTSDADLPAVPVTTADTPAEPDYWYENGLRVLKNDDGSTRYAVCKLPFRQQLLAQLTVDELRHHVTRAEHAELHALESDTDNSYVQTLLLAAESCPELKDFDTKALWIYTDAIRKVFIQEKRHELALVLRFTRMWVATEDCDHETLTSEWAAGHRTEAVGISKDQQSEEPQPSEPYKRAVPQNIANLSIEIAIALLYPDAVPGKINRAQLMAAKELADQKRDAHARALKVLGKTTDILDYDPNSIFGVTRAILWAGEESTNELRSQVREWFTANGIYENGERSKGYPEWDEDPRAGRQAIVEEPAATSQPQVANLGGGVFSIEGLMNETQPQTDDRSPVKEETTSDVQMEETDLAEGESVNAVQPGESADAADPQTDSVELSDILAAAEWGVANDTQPEAEPAALEGELMSQEPAPEYPAYFEPGRYEGLPNNVYHAANGISSTQVKDARVSLMFYHGRHVTKTIRRESSEALTFGSLAHTLALEPEKLHEEFAVFPGVPEGAFTTTDSMKAFIREFNADKPKAEQLKLTGKKEELQAAIRAVNPDAIFADEYEQQWRDSVAGKTILSSEQLALATAIQQALLNHESAGKLLRHPSRSVETSYFGMDDETGLEVRVRPDLEVEINGVRIGVDLKTISMGRIKQDGLRAKLHREIIDRDYHLSAGMYCSVADFDQFFWIFVNKDEGYHWVAVIEASEDLLALGTQEYQKTMRALAQAYDTNCWPAPITEDYTDELNDFDLRRLEALRLA